MDLENVDQIYKSLPKQISNVKITKHFFFLPQTLNAQYGHRKPPAQTLTGKQTKWTDHLNLLGGANDNEKRKQKLEKKTIHRGKKDRN